MWSVDCRVIRVIKSRIRWEGYVACMMEASWDNIGNNNNIEIDFKIRLRWRGVDPLAQGRVLWRLL
jgi:hypothetical protein